MDLKKLYSTVLSKGKDPKWWLNSALPYGYRQVAYNINKQWYNKKYASSWTVFDEEWDTLFILDGCRADLWEQSKNDWDWDIKQSQASSTPGFLKSNFHGKQLFDTVYVTANPQIENPSHRISVDFHAIDHVWNWGWNKKLGTVTPRTMEKAVIEAHKQYPNKRIIAHFVQPHHPFIGDVGREISKKTDARGWEGSRNKIMNEKHENDGRSIWGIYRSGDISYEEVWESYLENLEITFPHIKNIIDNIEGQIVITSDHGNLMGERLWPIPYREYGHPLNLRAPKLINVPWASIKKEEKREITSEAHSETSHDTSSVESRLQDLGYK